MTTRRGDEAEEPAQGRTDAEHEREHEADVRSAVGNGSGVKAPEPEETPELLGERSDYPIPRGSPR